MAIVMHRCEQSETDGAYSTACRVNRRPDDQYVRKKAHDKRSYDSADGAKRGDIACLVLWVPKLVLQVGWHPVVYPVVGELDEEKGQRVREDTGNAERSSKGDVLDRFIVFDLVRIGRWGFFLLDLARVKDIRLLSDFDAFQERILNQAEQVDQSHEFNQSSKKDERVSPVLDTVVLCEHQVDSLSKDVANGRICGPNPDYDPTSLSRKPIT